MGAILAYAFIYTHSILVSVVIHFFNNAFTVTAYYAYLKDWLPYDPLTEETGAATWWMAAISLLLSILVVRKKAITYNKVRSNFQ